MAALAKYGGTGVRADGQDQERRMTAIERDCRFEWIEAAIRWHQEQVVVHRDAETELNRMHTQLCRTWDEDHEDT